MLDDELLTIIIRFLDYCDWLRVSQTCSSLRRLIRFINCSIIAEEYPYKLCLQGNICYLLDSIHDTSVRLSIKDVMLGSLVGEHYTQCYAILRCPYFPYDYGFFKMMLKNISSKNIRGMLIRMLMRKS